MSVEDFPDMDEMEQAEAVWSGKYVGTRDETGYRIIVCQIFTV